MADGSQHHRVHERLTRSRQLLGRLARSEALARGDVTAAYREVAELATELLDVERASVWLFDALRTEIQCLDLYERSQNRHSEGALVTAADVPSYFAALAQERVIAAGDAHSDPRTAELSRSYLGPLGIGAMLDAPIWVGGSVVGVVCHEHVGEARRWSFVEELLAGTVADFVARVFEASQRVRAEEALGAFRQRAEELMRMRSSQAEQLQSQVAREIESWRSEKLAPQNAEELLSVLESSPVPLLVSGLDDAIVRYVNRRGAELFETSVDDMVGSRGVDFWLDPRDRIELADAVRGAGRADGFVARLKTRHGRPFWALLSARQVSYQGSPSFIVGFADITAQKVAELAVRESEERIRRVFEAAPVALILSRASDRKVLLANPVAARVFEVPIEQVVGQQTPDYYVDPSDRDRIVQTLLEQGFADGVVTRLRTATGREFWGMLSARRLVFEGDVCFLVGVADVTAQKQAEQTLLDLATRDALTGVPNRRRFEEVGRVEIARAVRTESPLAAAMIDVDHFKQVNDAHGHAVGDRLLSLIASESRAELRVADVLARVGGEEFAVLFPDTDLESARVVAERLRQRVAGLSVDADGATVSATISVGIAELARGEELEQLLARADAALYRAKEAGRNRVAS